MMIFSEDGIRRGRGFYKFLLKSLLVIALFPAFPICSCSSEEDNTKQITRNPAAQSATAPAVTLGQGDLYALVIGVAKYKLSKLDLKVSDNDATQFAEFLKTQRKVFKNTHVKLLTNEAATKVEIEKLLNYEFLKAGKNDTVILFFSGHGSGAPKKPGDFFFLGHDAEPEYLEATSVKMSGLSFLKGIDAQRILVIADACHAGAFPETGTKSVEKTLSEFSRQFSESSGRAVLTSSKPEEYSQEKPGLKNSVFTYYLLKGLRGDADVDRDGVVKLKGLYDYVYEQTKNETGGAQHPQLDVSRQVGGFPISVLSKPDEPIKLEALFIAQDPRCTNKQCIDPPDERAVCNDPLCKDVELRDGAKMYSGGNYQIAIRPSATGYVYIYQIGTNGELYSLFPGEDYLSPNNKIANPLKVGEIYWIPGKNGWLRLDDQQGQEKIYVVASRSRNQVLENLYEHLAKLRSEGCDTALTRATQKEFVDHIDHIMGVTKTIIAKARITSDDRKIRSFEKLRRIFEAPDLDAVVSVGFEHQSR